MRPVVVLVVVVTAVAVVVVGVVGTTFGPEHWVCGTVGFGLSLPPAAVTLWLTGWLAKRSPFGALMGMAVGTPVRLTATLVAAGALFVAARQDDPRLAELADPLKFWLWVLVGYVVTLVVETVLAARATPPAKPPEREVA
jgi:Na+(H+)/acetate symporter ActP